MARAICSSSLLVVCSCFPSLQLKQIAAEAHKPANVMVLFNATAKGEPVTNLTEAEIKVTEDGFPVELGRDALLMQPDFRPVEYTVLLLDLGGTPTQEELRALANAMRIMGREVGEGRRFQVLAIDGREKPLELVTFGSGSDAVRSAADRLLKWRPRDTSRDLFGGYSAAVRALGLALKGVQPRVANIVLIGRGPDRAARADEDRVDEEVEKLDTHLARYAIGIGAQATAAIDNLADSSPILATIETLDTFVESVASRIRSHGRSFYFFSACSAARAGKHELRIEARRKVQTTDGDVDEQNGTLIVPFDADGFGAGCAPQAPTQWR